MGAAAVSVIGGTDLLTKAACPAGLAAHNLAFLRLALGTFTFSAFVAGTMGEPES